MTPRTFSLATAIVFSVVAVGHAIRLLLMWHVTIQGVEVPIWLSWIGFAIGAYLAYEGFRLATRKER